MKINSKEYWNYRFGSGDWEKKMGYNQTKSFAECQIRYFDIDKNFEGIITDFGCGAGDAFPIYKKYFPKAKLIGIDFSEKAIELCKKKYGTIADYYVSDVDGVLYSDIIICSNVLEHIEDDKRTVKKLLKKCKKLYVTVPYLERPLCSEHLRIYNINYFDEFRPVDKKIFLCEGWSHFGIDLIFNIYIKNIARFILGRPIVYQRRQIMYVFNGENK